MKVSHGYNFLLLFLIKINKSLPLLSKIISLAMTLVSPGRLTYIEFEEPTNIRYCCPLCIDEKSFLI